jgi:hypothetical protein
MGVLDKIDAFSLKLVEDLRNNLECKDRSSNKSANRLAASITPKVTLTSGGVILQVLMNDYWYWVNYGRDNGPVAEEAKIKDWIRRKGIDPRAKINSWREAYRNKVVKNKRVEDLKPVSYKSAIQQFEYLVRRKVKEKGFEGNNFFSEVVDDGRLDILMNEVAQELDIDVNGTDLTLLITSK